MPSDAKWTPPKGPGAEEMTRLIGNFKLPAAANGEAIEALNRRVSDAMDEMKALLRAAGKS